MSELSSPSETSKIYELWRTKCILNIKEKLRLNVEARSKKLEEIVNETVVNLNRELHLKNMNDNNYKFKISNNIILSSLESMYNNLDGWNGVALSNCKKIPKSFDEYWYIADNWWNRQKNKWFGDTYFYYIFQYSLYQYSSHLSSHLFSSHHHHHHHHHLINSYCDVLYYSMLDDIFTATIFFKRARAMPLLFDQSLEKSHILRTYCCKLLSIQIDKNGKNNTKNKIKFRHIVHQKIVQIKSSKFNQFKFVFQQRNQQQHEFEYEQKQQQQQQQQQQQPPMTLSTTNSVHSSNSSNSSNSTVSSHPYHQQQQQQQQFVNDSYNNNVDYDKFSDNNTVFCNYNNNNNYNDSIYADDAMDSFFQNHDDMMSIFQTFDNNHNDHNNNDSLF